MKKGRIILTVVLIAMIGWGWFSQTAFSANQTESYHAAITEADACYEKQLYQKAIILYEDALKLKEDKEIREKWLRSYESASEAEEITNSDYINAMKKVVEIYPKRTDLWEALIKEAINRKDFKEAKDYYEDAIDVGADKDVISKYKNTIYYSVSENNRIFASVLMSSQGYFTVFDGNKWGVIDSAGKWIYECIYDYAGPVINNDVYFLTTSKDSRIYNNSKVAQAIFTEKSLTSKVISEGIVPLCSESVWKFYDYQDEKYILDSYDDVSCFIDGKAAIKNSGKWSVIDKSGTAVSDKEFDDIKLLGTGEYVVNGIMIASVNGKYGIYDASGKSKSDFTASNMDKCMGGNIAFEDSKGKWGFVNGEGKIVIEPDFDEAMSFSNGLAAVRSGDKWGFINESGELVIEYQYSDGGYFNNNGICFVGLSDEQLYMISLRFKGEK